MQKAEDEQEIIIDADSHEEIAPEETEVAATALKDRLKKLRKELRECQKERDDNLAGWQRSKADLVNFRRNVEEDKGRHAARAQGKLAHAIIPALDSFDSAMTAESWSSVDATWREGVERIATQLTKAMATEGLEVFGIEGDQFDPMLHESMSVVSTSKAAKDNTIAQVLQKGYRIGDEIIRPAKVVVAQKK